MEFNKVNIVAYFLVKFHKGIKDVRFCMLEYLFNLEFCRNA